MLTDANKDFLSNFQENGSLFEILVYYEKVNFRVSTHNCKSYRLTLRWPRWGVGGGLDGIHPPTGFSNFSQKWEELFLQTKFLPVRSSLGHLHIKNFSNWTYHLSSKIRQREGTGGWQPPPIEQKLTFFLTMKMVFNLNKFWHEVR